MSVLCSAAPWPTSCLESLARVLESGERDRMLSWMSTHMDETEDSWVAFVVAVVAVGSELMLRSLPKGIAITYAPAAHSSLDSTQRDAELLTTMVLNEDWPGVTGMMRGLDERGAREDVVGALMAYATTMLQLEAYLEGRTS